jgi:hypothetical protein
MLLPLISGNKNGSDGLNMENNKGNRNNCYVCCVIPAITPTTFPQGPTENPQYII